MNIHSHNDVETLSVHQAPPGAHGLVPSGFAEKAMASLMQLHGELVEEKERRVELFRRLMEKEQALAELRMYIRLLEEKAQVAPPQPVAQSRPQPEPQPKPPSPRARPPAPPPPAPARAQPDGWKVW